MVRILSSFLLFLITFPYAIELLDLSCHNYKRKQFFELFEPRLPSFPSRVGSQLYPPRPLLVPSSPETDEINATADHCSTTTLIDIDPLPTFAPPDINITEVENVTIASAAANLSEGSPSENEPPIVTFEEWTKQKLEQEKLKHVNSVTNGNHQHVDHLTPSSAIDKAAAAAAAASTTEKKTVSSSSSSVEEKVHQQTTRVIHTLPLVVSKRNYASKECGSKVIESNEEAEKTGAILNDKEKDEYMRNPCEKAKDKYMIIELCETIQPKSIELANFELFSSTVKNFRILASERTPPLEWITLGEFEAQDIRDVQTFQIPDHSIYTKFIRLELQTHYGKEHYCTLSSFRVYGISMVDEYEAEATAAAFDIVENAGAPIKMTSTETKFIEPPAVEPVPIPTVPQVTEPPVEATLEVPPIFTEVASPEEEEKSPLAPWEFNDCQKCDSNHPKAVSVWLCYVFSPSICSQRNIKVPRNITSTSTAKGQIKFLKLMLKPKMCPYQNISVEKRPEENVVLPSTPPPTTAMKQDAPPIVQVLETEIKKQKQTSYVPLPAGTTNHKESVFLKLNKRLAQLELNISLSSQYLAELSRQYVAQTEENRKSHEKTTKYIEEAISRAAVTLSKQFGEQILEMQKQVKDLFSRYRTQTSAASSHVIPSRHTGNESRGLMLRYPTNENCRAEYERIDLHESDGLWTTEQLVVVIAAMQATTFGMIFVLQYLWKSNVQQKVVLISSDIDVQKIIAAQVQKELDERSNNC